MTHGVLHIGTFVISDTLRCPKKSYVSNETLFIQIDFEILNFDLLKKNLTMG